MYIPCLLCGQIHPLSIHAYLERKVRSPEDGQNMAITIIAIICRRAKEQGTQYTKRILPPFVIPYCVISRERVWAYLCRFPDGRLHSVIASQMLGTVDLRTIRRHLREALTAVKEAALQLARVLSTIPAFATLPDGRGRESELKVLCAAAEQMNEAAVKLRGGSAPRIPALGYLHAVSVYRRARRPLKIPLTSVVRLVVFHDTS
jgi:hypothetical protein